MRNSWKKTFAGVAGLVFAGFLAAAPRPVQAVLIDFEGLNDLEVVTNQYAGVGVLFSNTTALIDGSFGGSLNELDFPPASPITVVTNEGGPIMVVFPTPFAFVSARFTYNGQLTLEAYSDAAGTNLIGSVMSAFNDNFVSSGNPPNELLGFANIGPIGSLKILGGPDFTHTVDDLDGAPIPEPASLILLGSGLGSAWLVRRRKRS